MAKNKLTTQQRKIWGKVGGRLGGPRRAKALSSARKTEIAKLGAAARWANGKALKA